MKILNRCKSLSQEDKPQSHLTLREIALETGISKTSVHKIVKKDLGLKCFKKRRATELTEANKKARLERSGQLLDRYPAHMVNFIWFTDEKLFTIATTCSLISFKYEYTLCPEKWTPYGNTKKN